MSVRDEVRWAVIGHKSVDSVSVLTYISAVICLGSVNQCGPNTLMETPDSTTDESNHTVIDIRLYTTLQLIQDNIMYDEIQLRTK